MKFEEFEKEILKKGYGIVAMNHYSINNKRYLYCVILDKEKAFKSEGNNSEEIFRDLYNQIIKSEKKS